MRVLLDTHAFLWWISNSPSLSSIARQVVADVENEVYLSAVSVWEMAIKARAGKLHIFSGDIGPFIDQHMRKNSFQPLPITLAHSAKVHALSNHHGDPFDQMLVAQSQVEKMPIISADKMMQSYDVEVVW